MSLQNYLKNLQKQTQLSLKDLSEQSTVPTRTLNRINSHDIESINKKTVIKFSEFENIKPEEVIYKISFEETNIEKCKEESLMLLSNKNYYDNYKIQPVYGVDVLYENITRSFNFDGLYTDTVTGKTHGLVDSWTNLVKQHDSKYKENGVKTLFKTEDAYIESILSFAITKVLSFTCDDFPIKFYDITFESEQKQLFNYIEKNFTIKKLPYELTLHCIPIKNDLKYSTLCPSFSLNQITNVLDLFYKLENKHRLSLEPSQLNRIKLELYSTSKILAEEVLKNDKQSIEGLKIFNQCYSLTQKGLAKPSFYNFKNNLFEYFNSKISDLENEINDPDPLYVNLIPITQIINAYKDMFYPSLCNQLKDSLYYTFTIYETLKEKQ